MKTGTQEGDLQHQDPFAKRCKLPNPSSRKKNCICQVLTLFPEAHNDLLIGKYISKSRKEGIKKLFYEMAAEFEGIIDEQEWMSKRTKFQAKEKVANMKINVGEQSPSAGLSVGRVPAGSSATFGVQCTWRGDAGFCTNRRAQRTAPRPSPSTRAPLPELALSVLSEKKGIKQLVCILFTLFGLLTTSLGCVYFKQSFGHSVSL